jgi:manganese/zinc/iron transport system permease protein
MNLLELFTDYTLRNIALGAAVLGMISGVLGSFAVLRRQSLFGDALSHAALPGVCGAFILSGGSKDPLVLLIGAAVAGLLGALTITVIIGNSRIKEDAAMGIVLSVFFGLGYVMLSMLQGRAGAGQAGLDRYLFGSAASLVENDVRTMSILALIALVVVMLFYKEFKLLTFDPDFLSSLGFPTRVLDMVLIGLLVLATVIGLQMVGVVLMSAMLIAPGAAARQWTHRFGGMLVIASLIGIVSGVIGALVSASANIPTGPAIVIVLSVLAFASFAFGADRGLVWTWFRTRRNRAVVLAGMGAAENHGVKYE